MFSEKYLKNCNIFDDQYLPPSDFSSPWRGVVHEAELIRKNLKWRVGDGTSIKFWYDHWLLPEALINFDIPSATINRNATVCDFWNNDGYIIMLTSVVPADVVN